jgi:hypothetical protein
MTDKVLHGFSVMGLCIVCATRGVETERGRSACCTNEMPPLLRFPQATFPDGLRGPMPHLLGRFPRICRPPEGAACVHGCRELEPTCTGHVAMLFRLSKES